MSGNEGLGSDRIFNALLTGVGGEGALLTSVIVARAANIEGHYVRGTQLHGLAQRGGSIPIHIRFGQSVRSPIIARGEADMLLGLEPMEAARFCYFASKKNTSFIIDNYQIMPLLARMQGRQYPSINSIRKMVEPFAKKIIVVDASNITAKKLGNPVFGNVMCLGIAVSQGILPLRKSSVLDAMKATVPRGMKQNTEAFRMGLEWKE
jgi:indolepyruvate ferredoxin oxidoreductase beta subunit